ncbi:MAG: hypothetical protein ACTHK7_24095 [Aureliella sp.]
MRACLLALVAATFFCSSARAEFVLQFDPEAKILANAPNQVVDLYLTSTTTVQISRLLLRAYLGDEPSDVLPEPGTYPDTGRYPASHLGTKGNFEKGDLYATGVQTSGEGYLWGDGPPPNAHLPADYGQNVTQVEITAQYPPQIEANQPAKVATLHIDTTGFFGPTLNIGLAHDDYFTFYNGFYTRVYTTNLSERSGEMYSIGSGLTVLGGEYQVSSTPEPTVIGLAGLGLVAGAGWIRSRRRRGKFSARASS